MTPQQEKIARALAGSSCRNRELIARVSAQPDADYRDWEDIIYSMVRSGLVRIGPDSTMTYVGPELPALPAPPSEPGVIRDEDLWIEFGCKVAHPKRDHPHMPCTAARVTHRPTGIAVTISNDVSPLKNKERALARLAEILSVDIVERVERETAEKIATWLETRSRYGVPVTYLAECIRDEDWRKP